MFIPLIIALLMGLISPSHTNSSNCHGGGTVYVNSGEPGEGDPGEGGEGEGGEGGEDDGEDGPGSGTGTGGGGGQIPPPKP